MSAFPDTVHFLGLNKPVRMEVAMHELQVEGRIPADVEGVFFRSVPDPLFPPLRQDDVILSADGMISKLEIRGGRASYILRYVQNERYEAQIAAGRAIFGAYRNPYTDDPAAAGVDRSSTNTTPVWHGGRLFMTKEDGRAWEINPHTLETIGKWDYRGKLRSQTMTAHPRIDPRTGEMFFFGYEAAGLCSKTIAYCVADADGELVSEQWFDAPYCAFMHDFALTESHVIFPVFPTTADLARVKAGGPHWRHEMDLDSWIGIMPRHGSVDEIVWIKGPKGVHAYHMMNAYTEGQRVHLDMCLADRNLIPFILEDSGVSPALDGGLTRWTMDLSHPRAGIEERRIGPFGEMPRTRDIDQGRDYPYCWYLTVDPEGGKPLHAGPAGVAFNRVLTVDMATGRIEPYSIGPGLAIGEPVHVPSSQPNSRGWLLAEICREVGVERYEQEIWVLNADDLKAGPVAQIKLPVAGRPQLHGCWVGAGSLAQARVRE